MHILTLHFSEFFKIIHEIISKNMWNLFPLVYPLPASQLVFQNHSLINLSPAPIMPPVIDASVISLMLIHLCSDHFPEAEDCAR